MNSFRADTPIRESRWISLHDSELCSIECKNNSVVFHFVNGFNMIEDDQIRSIKEGSVELNECTADDFRCYIIKRKPTRKGIKSVGKPVTLCELSKMLSQKEKTVQIYLEFYDDVFFHWRGDLYPHKKSRLTDSVVIEANDFFKMTYFWK